MNTLNKKLRRDIASIWMQIAAIALILACGIATFIMSLSTLQTLKLTQEQYYNIARFASVFVQVKRAPLDLVKQIRLIPGVSHVEPRVVVDVTLDIPGRLEPVTGRLISFNPISPPELNQIQLRAGRLLEASRSGEILASEAFVKASGLKVGDSIAALLNGRRQKFRIVGVVNSPEYIYPLRGQEILPNPESFGIFWIGEVELSAALDMNGAFNDLSLTLISNTHEAHVKQAIDMLTAQYGGIGAYGREDQSSHKFVTNEISELEGMTFFAPLIFLLVTTFLIHMVLSRIIMSEREQIAMLKAFGYSSMKIGLHYCGFALVIFLVGTILGILLGIYLGVELSKIYVQFFHFPHFQFYFDSRSAVLASALGFIAAFFGVVRAVRSTMRLPPAEAMRPATPTGYGSYVPGGLAIIRVLRPRIRMIARSMLGYPLRSLSAFLGIALSAAVLVIGLFTKDALDFLIEVEFTRSQRQDLTVSFAEPSSISAIYSLRRLSGVSVVEPFRVVPTRVRFEHRSRLLPIVGILPDSDLRRIISKSGEVLRLPSSGILISRKLGQVLGAKSGDVIQVEFLEGKRLRREVSISGMVDDVTGLNAYMNISSLNETLGEGQVVSGGFINARPGLMHHLYEAIKSTPKVGTVIVTDSIRDSIQETIVKSLMTMRYIISLFACLIAFGVLYNFSKISIAEKTREFATLRVLGFSRREVSLIFFGEQILLLLLAIPFGLFIGYHLATAMGMFYQTELFRIPIIISPSTYLISTTSILVTSIISGVAAYRQLKNLDLIDVLKSRE